jgi:hypothetical protein
MPISYTHADTKINTQKITADSMHMLQLKQSSIAHHDAWVYAKTES